MKNKIMKLSMVGLMTFALLSGSMFGVSDCKAATSSSFKVNYISGAPTSVYTLSQTRTITASGNDYVRVTVDTFSVSRPGASLKAKGSEVKTSEATFTSAGTSKLRFQGTTIPRAGVNVSVKVFLVDYAGSLSVTAEGKVKQ